MLGSNKIELLSRTVVFRTLWLPIKGTIPFLLIVLMPMVCLAQTAKSKANRRAQPDPPFSGTVFIDPDIITSSDSTTFQRVSYSGQGSRRMFDRRVNNWITVNAYLFNASFDDGLTAEIQVNPEFDSSSSALAEAQKYGWVIGQLPTALRADVQTVWIHKGTRPFGGGNNNLLIHTGQADLYEDDGILEETLVHEAAHTSLDAAHAAASGWRAAQTADGGFISTYARDFPDREDIAESFLPYLAVRYRSDRISKKLEETILQTIPDRISYFDNQSFDMYPISSAQSAPEATAVPVFEIKPRYRGLSDNQNSISWKLAYHSDSNIMLDDNDVLWDSRGIGGNVAKVYSLVEKSRYTLREMSIDSRGKDNFDPNDTTIIYFDRYPRRMTSEAKREFEVNIVDSSYFDPNRVLTLQQISVKNDLDSDGELILKTYPPYDVRKVDRHNKGIISFQDDLLSVFELGLKDPWRTSDLNFDNYVDPNDLGVVGNMQGFVGNTYVDVSGPNQIPDGVVDTFDYQHVEYWLGNVYSGPPVQEYFNGFEENDSLSGWTTRGDASWYRSRDNPNDGNWCVRSGEVDNDESSTLTVKKNFTGGEISFAVRVSTERNFDMLTFSTDGQEMGSWSGEHGWEVVSYPISPGAHTLEWIYSRDGSESSGQDAAWIDDVRY